MNTEEKKLHKEIVEELKNKGWTNPAINESFAQELILDVYKIASNRLEKIVSQKTAGGWRDAKKDPPELSTSMKINAVLVIHRNYIKFGWKTEIGWHIENSPSYWDEEIKYWMPLPELPE